MRKIVIGTLFLVLPFMSFLSLAVAPKKEEKQEPAVETISSVIIDHLKKIISESDSIPTYYTESIRNASSEKPAFVNIDIYRLNNIGEDKEDLTKVELTDDADIYVMPNQIIVPASGVRTVRVYLTKKLQRSQDTYFRIRFSPSTSPAQDDTAQEDKNIPESSLFLGMGAGQLLMVSRDNPSFDTNISLDKNASGADELIIHNMGNSFIRLDNMKTCFMKERKKPCTYASGRHVNAGDMKILPIDNDIRTIVLELIEGDRVRKVEYDRQASKPLKMG